MHAPPNPPQDRPAAHEAARRRLPAGATRWCRYAALGGAAVFLAGAWLPVPAEATQAGQDLVGTAATVAPDLELELYIADRKAQLASYHVENALELNWLQWGVPA